MPSRKSSTPIVAILAVAAFGCTAQLDDVDVTSEALEICRDDQCGPPLTSPTILCGDGSIGGNTGRCVRDDAGGSCYWEQRECPEASTECGERDCGPPLRAPTILCDDGSIGGNTGRCLPDDEGGCSWELRECPSSPTSTPVCDPEDCGPPLAAPTYRCEDGSIGGNTGRCLPADDGCAWELRECP